MCSDCRTPYPEGVLDPPCRNCDSIRRTFRQTLRAEIKAAGSLDWMRSDKDDQLVGYGDTGKHGTIRHGNLEADDTISMIIEGKPPRNEEDTGRVCRTLAAAVSQDGEHFTAVVSGDRDVDGELKSPSRVLRVQVVKALAEIDFWKRLALTLRISQRLSLSQAIELVKAAIEHKTASLPPVQRKHLVLALDADRLPALALQPVVTSLKATHGPWIAAQGFEQVWLVGPDVRLTWRLDS